MRKLALIVILGLIAGPVQAVDYMIGFVPRLALASGLYTETCGDTGAPSGWTDQSENTGNWIADGTDCEAQTSAGNDFVAMAKASTEGTNVFCSMQVTDIGGSAGIGCTFRGGSGVNPGAHYWLGFSNNASTTRFWSHSTASHTSVTLIAAENAGGTGICCSSTYNQVANNDWIGFTVTGTGSSTVAKFWNRNGGTFTDPQDPGTWPTADCECDAGEVSGETFTEVDTVGSCGPSGFAVSANDANWPQMDTFACGDIP